MRASLATVLSLRGLERRQVVTDDFCADVCEGKEASFEAPVCQTEGADGSLTPACMELLCATVQAPSYSDCLECRTQQGALGQILDKCRMLFPVDRPSAISTFQPVTNVSASATVSASTSASASETASPGSEDPSSTTTHGATSTTSPGAVAGSGTTIASSVASDTSTIATKTDYESKSVPSYFPQTLSPPPSGSGTGTASTDAASAARAAGPVLGVLALAAAVGTVATLL